MLEQKAPGKFMVLPMEGVNATDEALYANTELLTAQAADVEILVEELLKTWREINANPADTADHPFGVWTLPPSSRTRPYSEGADANDPKFDRTKYDAIGESDRMTLKFRKPGAAA